MADDGGQIGPTAGQACLAVTPLRSGGHAGEMEVKVAHFKEGSSMNEATATSHENNLRTEYSAICSNLNQLASFRFMLVGFYVTALGLIVRGSPGRDKFLLMLWISLCFWILELRNRGLHSNMTERAMQIEREHWGYRGKRVYEPFISHWNKKRPLDDSEASEPPGRDTVRILFWNLKLPVSHTLGLDLLFLGVIVYSAMSLLLWQ
jgi:hypothetical protein